METRHPLASQRLRFVALCALAVALAGCGGGGGDNTPTASATITVAPSTITIGQSATLTWSSNTTCTASGGWSGSQPSSGTQDVTPTATGNATYTITCTGSGYNGTATSTANLTVNAASAYTATSLVEDQTGGTAPSTDPLLTNPWGIVAGPTTPMWVANNHSDTSTLYNGNGTPLPVVAHFAPGAGGASFDPTGIVFNTTTGFTITNGTATAAAAFIFDGEGGSIAGWSSAVDVANAITVYTATDGAVYKGLAIASNGAGNFLYAADFANGKVDVFDAAFAKQPGASFPFADPALPAGYGPFGIQAITKGGTTRIYVAYAKHDTSNPDDEADGAGLGVVDVYDTNGAFVKRLVGDGGKLNAPWGLALAPSDFGTLGNALIVGNFGDGTIHGYDPDSGRYIGELGDGAGTAFAVPGLWGLAFGNDAVNQPHATLFFAAGTNAEVNGRYGRIDLGATAPTLGDPPAITLIVPAGNLSGTVTLQANETNLVAIDSVQFFLNGTTSLGTATTSPYTVQWDTTTVANGSATLRAIATGAPGNVGSSRILTVTVANTAPAATLTQVQTNVFTPRCSGCHNGSAPAGGALPGSMDLRAGASFASIVSVPSLEQAGLMRVKPGDPDNSYLIHKVEGTAGITGAQMPFGGPFLDQPTIDQIRSWIGSGAPNN